LAPFDGITGLRQINVGDYLKDGADMVNIEDIDAVLLDFRLPERFQAKIRAGQKAQLTVDALPGRPFTAIVQAVDPLIEANGRSVGVRGCIDNRQQQLRPGMFARVNAVFGARENALVIPEEAIIPQGGRTFVVKVVAGEKRLIVKHGQEELSIAFDQLLCAVGRSPRVTGLGLEALGMALSPQKTIQTNAFLQTTYPNIYAVGDVAGPYQLTHMAAHQAWYAAVNALFGRFKRFKANYSAVPWAIFTDPEVARVGLSETEARAQGVAYELTRYDISDLDRAIADGAAHGFVKVLTVPGKDKILGVTIVGEHAGELLAEYVLAMTHGLGLNKILGTIHSYPTLTEANKFAAGQWKRAHAPQRVLGWLARWHAWQRS
jgi:hypothetical protein